MQPAIEVFADRAEWLRRAAGVFVSAAEEAVKARGSFSVALSGGSTPPALYALLASEPFRSRMPWQACHFFWGDDRHVPPDHSDSNYRLAREALLSKVPAPDANIHRIQTELSDAAKAAELYEETIRRHFNLKPGQLPRFDLIHLGMGADGHTASLFPGSDALKEAKRLVLAPWTQGPRSRRITLTLPVLNNAASVLFFVGGRDKAEAARRVLAKTPESERLPAGRVKPEGGALLWLLDSAAASLLD